MSYSPTNWVAGDAITADKMNNLENGVVDNSTTTTSMATALEALSEKINDLAKALIGEGLVIVEQPQNITAAVGAIIAIKIKVYSTNNSAINFQWQNKLTTVEEWNNTTLNGYNTDTLTVQVTEARYKYDWRCVMTYQNIEYISDTINILPTNSSQ